MKFLGDIAREIYLVIGIIVLLIFTFFVYDLPSQPLWVIIGLILLTMGIYWIVRWFYFNRARDLQTEFEEVKLENRQLKEAHVNYQKDIEQYFLIWVHQIKTPITALKLLINRLPAEYKPSLKEEVLQIENYTELTLSYLKLMNHNTDMNIERVNLERVINQIVKRYSVEFINYQTSVSLELKDAKVLTDARWTSIMIEQLINNAVKYARSKSIHIEYDAETKKLSVNDTGIGISEADIHKIFDKGYSGLNGQYDSKSSGIGLYIVETISQRLKHPVDVESTIGEGSTFTIYFQQTR